MGARIRWLAVVATTALGVAAVVWAICRWEPITSWNSPRMLAVQKDWQALDSSYAGTWSQYNIEAQNKSLDLVLDKGLSRADLRRLALKAEMLPLRPED